MTPIVNLECEFRYEASHHLTKVPPDHKCARAHGHSYHLTVVVQGEVRDDGFVCDFADVKEAVKPVIDKLDHHDLNDYFDNPTVELQLVWIWQQLHKAIPLLRELRLRETATNSATYRGEKR